MIFCGIDIGSRSVKLVFVEETPEGPCVVARHMLPHSELDLVDAAARAYDDGLMAAGISAAQVGKVVATGSGRKLADFAAGDVTEVSAAARGAACVCPSARAAIDVGAEECLVVKIDAAGQALDFSANDKCSSGAGSFAESMARALQLPLEGFGAAALRSTRQIPMNARCTVFAESEVVSLIHAATPVDDIARAVVDALADRVAALARRLCGGGEALLIGGMARNPGFVRALRESLAANCLHLPEFPEYVSALGAALIAAERQRDTRGGA